MSKLRRIEETNYRWDFDRAWGIAIAKARSFPQETTYGRIILSDICATTRGSGGTMRLRLGFINQGHSIERVRRAIDDWLTSICPCRPFSFSTGGFGPNAYWEHGSDFQYTRKHGVPFSTTTMELFVQLTNLLGLRKRPLPIPVVHSTTIVKLGDRTITYGEYLAEQHYPKRG